METDELFARSCRICSINLVNGVFVFGDEGRSMYLQAKIRKYLYITISAEDKLPKMICENCCRKLDGIHKFATMAVKIQDKFNNILNNTSLNNVLEPKKMETKGLLHTYLTQGINDDNNVSNEITEMEVKVDPMVFLQCSLEEYDSSESLSDSDSGNSKEKTGENNYFRRRSPKQYECNICPKKFTSDIALKNHKWIHLPKKRLGIDSLHNTDIFQCIENKTCTSNSSSEDEDEADNSENASEDLRYSCPICGKDISTKGNLKVHLETHRPKGKYACDICGRIFKTQCNLHRHKEYHEGIQFPCTVCGRVYPTNSTLRAHSITHSDLRPHKCPLCDKTFKRNQDLKFHINQHTGARPYQCPYCPKAFASSGNCFSHRKRMHPIEVERDKEKAAKIMR